MFLGSFIYFKQEVTVAGARRTHGIPGSLTSPNHQTSPQCRGAIIFCHWVTLSFTLRKLATPKRGRHARNRLQYQVIPSIQESQPF